MTLIVGVKYKNIAVLGADTQVSRKDQRTKSVIERTLLHKLDLFNNMIFSYLGTWELNNENTLDTFRNKTKVKKFSKALYAKFYLKNLDRDAVIIGYMKLFGIHRLSFLGKKAKKVQKLKIGKREYIFNDPYSEYDNYDSVRKKIKLKNKNINDGIDEHLFMVNNLILEEIVQGKDLDIPLLNNRLNIIGGYVTLSILTINASYKFIPFLGSEQYNLYKSYNGRTLLDGNTNPFTNNINQKQIKYIDNLSMIFNAAKDDSNIKIKKNLIIWLELQIAFISQNDIIPCYLLRLIVNHINNLADYQIDDIECNEENEYIFIDENELEIDYCKSFFD